MFETLDRVFSGRSGLDLARDVVDVAIVAYVIYRLLLIVRGTRAMQMGTGLGVVFLLYLAAKALQLVTLLSLLSSVLSSVILIVVVVFQNDIRRALVRVGGRGAWFGRRRRIEQSRVIDEVVAGVTELARHRIGAIIAVEQDANLLEFAKKEGTIIGAAVTRELLVAIFYPDGSNKLHDGAVIVHDLKIARAGVFFPMPEIKGLDPSMGTRHQAALGITEETDAVVVVVSEERGTISYCFNGNIVSNLDATSLRGVLVDLLEHKTAKPAPDAKSRATLVPPGPTGPQKPPASLALTTTGGLPAAAPATSTPMPRHVTSRHERVRTSEPPMSREGEVVHARGVSTPMPRAKTPSATKSIVPTPAGLTADTGPASDRPSFVQILPDPIDAGPGGDS